MKTAPATQLFLPVGRRFCFTCRRTLGRNDKWHAAGCLIVHDNCADPAGTLPPAGSEPIQFPEQILVTQETDAA